MWPDSIYSFTIRNKNFYTEGKRASYFAKRSFANTCGQSENIDKHHSN